MDIEKLLDQVLMSDMGSKGSTLAHMFLQDRLARPITDIKHLKHMTRQPSKVFIPQKEEDRVIMFKDNSGIYVHNDGFCTPMGDDISKEVIKWVQDL